MKTPCRGSRSRNHPRKRSISMPIPNDKGFAKLPWNVLADGTQRNRAIVLSPAQSALLDDGIRIFGLDRRPGNGMYGTHLDGWAPTRQDARDKPFNTQIRIILVDRENRAMLRGNLSARPMPEDGQEHVLNRMLLPSRSSFGRKAISLLIGPEAPTEVKHIKTSPPVGHTSVFNDCCLCFSDCRCFCHSGFCRP
jgi:hypothetical protein